MPTITADLADEILEASYAGPGETAGDYTIITVVKEDARRWMQGIRIIVSDPDGAFWGLSYDRGLTEEQPNEYPWRDSGSYDLERLYAHTITKTVYRRTPAEVTA